jgi:hypothetical protein
MNCCRRRPHFGFLSDPKAPAHELGVKDAQAAASAIGGTTEVLTAATGGEIDAVFARIAGYVSYGTELA